MVFWVLTQNLNDLDGNQWATNCEALHPMSSWNIYGHGLSVPPCFSCIWHHLGPLHHLIQASPNSDHEVWRHLVLAEIPLMQQLADHCTCTPHTCQGLQLPINPTRCSCRRTEKCKQTRPHNLSTTQASHGNTRGHTHTLKEGKHTTKATHPIKRLSVNGAVRENWPPSFLYIKQEAPFTLNRRHAETIWANCLRKPFRLGLLGWVVLGVGFFPMKTHARTHTHTHGTHAHIHKHVHLRLRLSGDHNLSTAHTKDVLNQQGELAQSTGGFAQESIGLGSRSSEEGSCLLPGLRNTTCHHPQHVLYCSSSFACVCFGLFLRALTNGVLGSAPLPNKQNLGADSSTGDNYKPYPPTHTHAHMKGCCISIAFVCTIYLQFVEDLGLQMGIAKATLSSPRIV